MKPKYTPDVATVLRETDPRRRKADRERAREDAQRPTPPGFFVARHDGAEGGGEPEGAPGGDAAGGAQDGGAERASAPSPWANGAGLGLDKAALPSAMAPAAGGEKEKEDGAAAPRAVRRAASRRRIQGKHVAVAVALGLTVAAFAVAMPMIAQRARGTAGGVDAAQAAELSAPARPSVAPSTTARPDAPAVLAPAAAASEVATPSEAPTATAATATAATRVDPKTPGVRAGKPREAADNPYDAAPAAPASAAAPPPSPSGAPSAPSAPPQQPTIAPSASAPGNHFDKPNYD